MAISHPSGTSVVDRHAAYPVPRTYAWLVFAMIFSLMLSDYLSRQVANAVFPFLKSEWALSDAQLGSLVSVVAISVGFLCVPFAMLADRYGRVKSITAMALVWSLATVACGLADSFVALFIARAFVGLGEAGYGSAGAAILVRVFPARLHATVTGSFLAASIFGSTLGVMLGGTLAQHFGWQTAFMVIGAFGLILAVIFPMLVKEPTERAGEMTEKIPLRAVMKILFAQPAVRFVYLGAGTGIYMVGTFIAWMPSYMNRYFDMPPDKAAMSAGLMILISGLGMVVGGYIVDRISRGDSRKRLQIIMVYALLAALLLLAAYATPVGQLHYMLLTAGMTVGSGFSGPAVAVLSKVTPASIHATAFAMMTMSMALLGFSLGPFVTGLIADHTSLATAFYAVPVTCLLSATAFYFAQRTLPTAPVIQ